MLNPATPYYTISFYKTGIL